MTRLIDADALDRAMYHKSFEVDDGRNVWNSGLWIRYKIYEEASREAPTVDAVPVEFIKTEIDRLIDDINDAVEDGTTEWAEIIMTRKATLELVLVKWRAERSGSNE